MTDSNGQKDTASKASADVHEDEFASADGKKVRLKIFRGDSEGGKEVEYVKSNSHSAEIEASEVEAEKRRVLAPLERKEDGENPYAIQRDLQEAMMEHANRMRVEDTMNEWLGNVLALKDRRYN